LHTVVLRKALVTTVHRLDWGSPSIVGTLLMEKCIKPRSANDPEHVL
jgi:hypothetical protein